MYNGSEPWPWSAPADITQPNPAERRWYGVEGLVYPLTGCHNAFYTKSSRTAALRGKETITVLINLGEPGHSHVFEIAFQPVPEVRRKRR
jgi:hypothetical protein